MRFLFACLQPHAVMMLFVALLCLVSYAFPGYRAAPRDLFWLLWLLLGILALVSWVMLVFA